MVLYRAGIACPSGSRPASGGRAPGLDFDPLRVRVDVEVVLAEEAHERDPEFPRHLDGEARRGRDGADNGHARHHRLLHDLEARAAADHENVMVEWGTVLEQHVADGLVDGVAVPRPHAAYRAPRARRR